MKKQTKLAVALLAFLCVGAGTTATVVAEKTNSFITASAETTVYEVNSLTFTGGSATEINAYPNDGSGKPAGNNDWDSVYTLKSGTGIQLNGAAADVTVKFPHDFYMLINGEVEEGAILTIDGTFYNAERNIEFVFNKCALQWNGEKWAAYVEPGTPATVYEVNSLTFTGGSATEINAYPNDGSGKPAGNNDWASVYTLKSGTGIQLNGVAADVTVKFPHDFYMLINGEVEEGAILTIDGTFYNAERNIEFVFNKCALQWNGEKWAAYVETPEQPEIKYTTYDIGALSFKQMQPDKTNMAYFSRKDGQEITIITTENDLNWTTEFAFETGTGVGVTLNDAALEAVVKFPGDLFLEMPVSPNKGDLLVIGGTFYSETLQAKYVIAESKFEWNGSAWVAYVAPGEEEPEVEHTTHDIGALEFHVNSSIGAACTLNNVLYLQRADKEALPVLTWEHLFYATSDDCFKVNGENATLNVMKSTGDGLYLEFNALEAGDVITFGGTFVCDTLKKTYNIAESKFVWNGTGWEAYVEYTNYDVGAMKILSTSTASVVNLYTASGEKFPITSWDYKFPFRQGSGVGLVLDGELLTTQDIKFPGDMYIGLGKKAGEGSVLTIGGVFYCVAIGVSYTIEESTFVFDGTTWMDMFDKVKLDAKTDIENYAASFDESNYYEEDWAYFTTIVEEANAAIDAAATEDEVKAIVKDAKLAMDKVVNKEESDAIFETLKEEVKVELAAYKSESDYRAAEWAQIQEIIEEANGAIDAATSVSGINVAVDEAKKAIDALKTNAQWEADEATVAAAKAELAAYKTEADYRAAEWEEIQAILLKASADLDLAIGDAEAIAQIVEKAKANLDAVYTDEVLTVYEAATAAAKAELAAYKTESDYSAAGWTAMQAILAKANADIDNAIGNQEAIDAIVADAKADMDEVLTAAEEAVEALENARVAAEEEVRAYYGALDHSKYDDEAEMLISGYVAEVMETITNATTAEEMQEAIASFKAKVEEVTTNEPSNENSEENSEDNGDNSVDNSEVTSEPEDENNQGGILDTLKEKVGCASVVDGGLLASVTLAAAAVAVLRKKKDD